MLIGSSFVFKKKGLLSSQKGKVAGEGLGYLKSVGSTRETLSRCVDRGILGYVVDGNDHYDLRCVYYAARRLQHAHVRPGEICNFAAYAFVEAIVVVR